MRYGWSGAYAAILCLVLFGVCGAGEEAEEKKDPFREQRLKMVETQIAGPVFSGRRPVRDKKVLEAMRSVPRHMFVPEGVRKLAYADRPLPIGWHQTISQPYMVGLMTELLELKGDEKVLEIGTGSGYQAAVLAEIVPAVYSIEIIPELSKSARKALDDVGAGSVKTKVGDGYLGWKEEAPFDCIIVTAAPDHVPVLLIRQLKDGGRMVVPVGPPGAYQRLYQITKRGETLQRKFIIGCAFVPLVRKKH